MYATKRRRRNVKTFKHAPKENQKSNPSKRHRERLNTELENLANLLPFEQTILTKLDKLSILRLAVSYLRIKSYFQVKLKISNYLSLSSNQQHEHERNRYPQVYYMDPKFSEGNAILDSLNGFILISNSNSEVFYSSRTVEQFLGFHQSDIIHQSIYELIHSEDREEFKRQLSWNLKLPAERSDLSLNELLTKREYAKYLERNFTVRFRCLLDNTSGFVTLDIIGRIGILHGQKNAVDINSIDNDLSSNGLKQTSYKPKNSKIMNNTGLMHNNGEHIDSEPTLALFAIAVPFGPPSLFELPQRDSLFRTKHKVNLAPLTLDQRGKLILGYTEKEFSQFGGYDLVHMDDLKYYANAHKELLKTGSSGLVCYRISNKDRNWQWIQTSMRIIYKSNKPECVIANHRPLTSEEGEELYYKRGLEFKLPYLCLYDFEANFNTIGNNYQSNNNNQLNEETCSLGKNILTNSRLNTNLINTQITNKLCPPTTVSLKSLSTSNNTLKPSKISKNSTKVTNKHHQNQKYYNNNTSLISRNDQQIMSTTDASYHFNGFNKMENLANSYALYDTPVSNQGSTLTISNDYQSFTDNAHYNYTNYLNSLNSYNYTNYTTPHTTYSIYTNPNTHSSNQQLVNSQNEQLIFNTTNNNNQITTTTTTPSSSSAWFDEASQPTSKLGQSAYSLINYANNPNNQNGYKYNDLFNCTTQGTTAIGKYTTSPIVDNFDKTTGTTYYLDDYHHNISSSHHASLNSNTNLYDYSKYNQNSLLSKSSSSSTTASSNDNINSNFNNTILKKEQNFLHTSPPVSIKTLSNTSSSSTSPTILSSQTSLSTNLQDHNNNTNSLFLPNNEINGLSNGLYKKYENFQNDLKIQSTNTTDRNSLHSFSTSSSCSSSASSSSNYCDETAVKSFIKQENCVLELAVGLNNTTNGIRNGFLMDYYSDFYQNNVTI